MEMTPSPALLRRHSAAEPGEGSAKKTKKVIKTVSKDHVEFVLASKPMPRSRPQPGPISEERRRNSAIFDEVVNARNDLLRSLQYKFRNDLATKGRVEVEVEVTDDKS